MAEVLIRCPNTGQAVSTGVGMPWEVFRTVTMEDNETLCTACGELHTWSKKDAFPDT